MLPLFKSRSEASTSLRGVLSPLSFDFTLQDVPNRAVHRWRDGPAQRAFLGRYQSAANTDDLPHGRKSIDRPPYPSGVTCLPNNPKKQGQDSFPNFIAP